MHVIIIQDGDTREILKVTVGDLEIIFLLETISFRIAFVVNIVLWLSFHVEVEVGHSFIFNFNVKKLTVNAFYFFVKSIVRGNAVQIQPVFPAKKLRKKIRALKIRMRQPFFFKKKTL